MKRIKIEFKDGREENKANPAVTSTGEWRWSTMRLAMMNRAIWSRHKGVLGIESVARM